MLAGPQTTTILGLCAVLPESVLTNEQLEQRFGAPELANIAKMSGVMERRVVAPGQCASDLALTAAERLLAQKQFGRASIDLLLFVSQTPDYKVPPTAAVLHGKLGLKESCGAFDINQACSAYPYALSIAHSMILSGMARHVLLLNADALTTLIHQQDRGLVPLHGDAACATLLGPSSEGGFESFNLGTDGSGVKHLLVPSAGSRSPSTEQTRAAQADADGCIRTPENLRMDGAAVFHFSLYKVPRVIKQALAEQSLTVDDLDLVVLHQANKTMMEMIFKSLKVPAEKQFFCLSHMGNSSGPSTAVALSEAWRLGKIRPGSRTLMCSFGAGLSWGTTVIRWPADAQPSVDLDPVVPNGELLSAAL